NLKLDEGGIREIEFFVQTLQLLYGGRHPEIRSPNTLLCLETLVRVGLVQTREAQQLKDAYLFLRKAEHRIQLTEEAQTHTLSSNSAEQKAVARKMGYFEDNPEEAREHFLEDLSRYRTMVQNIFNSLFE
ncbi:MAG: hypothetical protein JNK65_01795, partial [Deltaproteobacteria bacterium]|nr:hypothetical protein [Deltaproteobacteria bacterium]